MAKLRNVLASLLLIYGAATFAIFGVWFIVFVFTESVPVGLFVTSVVACILSILIGD